jgi:hypothetical protein
MQLASRRQSTRRLDVTGVSQDRSAQTQKIGPERWLTFSFLIRREAHARPPGTRLGSYGRPPEFMRVGPVIE